MNYSNMNCSRWTILKWGIQGWVIQRWIVQDELAKMNVPKMNYSVTPMFKINISYRIVYVFQSASIFDNLFFWNFPVENKTMTSKNTKHFWRARLEFSEHCLFFSDIKYQQTRHIRCENSNTRLVGKKGEVKCSKLHAGF